ncbi:MarR family transcriptional regulator [Bacillus sp. AFS018417]|uniref:MarR family winged helix-turn-helix transcriptional regulator n=1 Tax=unclassified Bacillus (in: firmicutes) TaxID=185979 RepID=UPI000BF7EDC6|nr:MarR family transcriptional regulator [Bacillus sp. AFS018417]PEZ07074.1 MarR family transcriptional regulator [Bacillus sp. AFS018417]
MKNDLIQQINSLQNHLNVQLASRFEHKIDNQLTAKQVLLLELIRIGITSTKDLATQLNISTSAVSQLLNKLETKEYITRNINKENRREIILKLAIKGERYFEELQMLEDEINHNVYGQLPLEDLKHLVRILEKLNTIVKGE